MQPQCPKGHSYDARATTGNTQTITIGTIGKDQVRFRVAPMYCQDCGHVYGLVSTAGT
jgi:hypothetical protein